MEDDDLAPSQFKVEADTVEETESVEECRTIIPGRRFQYLNWIIWSSGSYSDLHPFDEFFGEKKFCWLPSKNKSG